VRCGVVVGVAREGVRSEFTLVKEWKWEKLTGCRTDSSKASSTVGGQ
jgi:hypothetical protein